MNFTKLAFLVIDDFDNVRKSIKGMLAQLGVQKIVEARDATEAFKAMKHAYFDVVLCDYNLGPGRDGQQLLEMVRTDQIISYRTIYVMITAETTRSMVMGALEFEPDDYMAKPFALETLVRRLERWLERQATLSPILDQIEKKQFPDAMNGCQVLMTTAPRYRAWAQRQLVDLLVQDQQLEPAKAQLLLAQEQREQAWIGYMLAKIEFSQQHYQECITSLNHLVVRYPNFVKAYDLMSLCHERLGQFEEARAAVSDGIRVSPRSVSRQLRMADLSEHLLDSATVVQSMKRVVKLLENSPKDSPQHFDRLLQHLQLVAAQTEDPNEKTDHYRDASRYLDRMQKRYVKDPDALIMAQIHKLKMAAHAARQSTASRLLELGQRQLDSASPELLLQMMQAFYDADMAVMANQWAEKLCERFADQPQIISKIHDIQAEPISSVLKAEVQGLNAKAIKLYRDGRYKESEIWYLQALAISPRQASLVLNYMQTVMQLLVAGDQITKRQQLLTELTGRLGYVDPQHPQFQRLQAITAKVQEIQERIHDQAN